MNVQVPPQQTKQPMPLQEGPVNSGRARTYLVGFCALALALGGYWYFTHKETKRPERNTDVPVRVGTVTRQNMSVVEHTIGTVVPFSTVQITSRVQGTIETASFKEGQNVSKGDLLFQIDPRPYQATLDSAQGALVGAKSAADRAARLIKQNAIAPQAYDAAQAAYLQAKGNVESAQINLNFTTIRSPVDGKTGPMLVQPGNMVSATAGTALVTINQIHPIKISFSLPQVDLPRIQARGKALTAAVTLPGANGESLSAPVDFISNAVSGTSGTIELRATFENKDAALVPGQLVNVVVALDDIPNAMVVPHQAMNKGPEGDYVYAVADGKAVQKPVKVLFDDSANVAVTGDLKPGEQVVVDGQLRLVPGIAVYVDNGGPAPQPSPAGKAKGKGRKSS